MRLVNGFTHHTMNHHWAKQLEPCKCGSKELTLFRDIWEETMLIQCGKCFLTGTAASTYEDAVRQFKMVQLLS